VKVHSNTTFIPNKAPFVEVFGATTEVDVDEPVVFLQELYAYNRQQQDHRWQVLGVIRADQIVGFWMDLGPATDFDTEIEGKPYRQPVYLQPIAFAHNVGECLEMAEQGRHDENAPQRLHERTMTTNLWDRFRDSVEQDLRLIRNQSQSGPYMRIERNGFSRSAKQEQQERLAGLNGY
jgi:hypothetical protein